MKRLSLCYLCLTLLLVLLASCSPAEPAASSTSVAGQPGPAETATGEPVATMSKTTTTTAQPATEAADLVGTETPAAADETGTPQPQELETLVRQDLASRLDLAPDEIDMASKEAVEWPDASLGCPMPGVAYAQVVTPGFEIVLEAQGDRYEYHTDQQHRFVLCQNGEPQFPAIPIDPGDIDDGEPWMPVDPPPPTSELP